MDTKFAKFAVDTKLNPPNPVEIYPTVPKPITVLVRLVVVNAPMIFVACIEDTKSCCVLIETANRVPTLICIVDKLVAITSPILKNALFEPKKKASTVSDEIYPWTDVKFWAVKEDRATVL